MDYRTFFNEVATWIEQCNQMAMQHSMESQVFWKWVSDSIGELSKKYGNNQLVNKQLVMLFLWLEDVYADTKKTQ
ncbi:hypothetical protein MKX47_12350 [Solibacillus sp. FSL R7-0668]|uniref:hypothetical protein n=1 Tax=Solibacillus sp. FSL R7-0668 TaxID=2921688 RepID=UPI0030F9732C